MVYPVPLDTTEPKHATRQRFRFLETCGDTSQTMKYFHYRPARIYRGEVKWHVEYAYRNPNPPHDFIRFKVYENINRIKDLKDKEAFAKKLKDAVNYHLEKGFNPFEEEMKIEVRNWTLVQGLNYWKQNLGNRGLRERSIKLYGSVLKFLYAYMAPVLNEDINKITKAHIQSAFRKAQTERSWTNSTFNNYATFTRIIFNYLKNEEIVSENPVKIKHLKENHKRHKYFSKEVFDKISKAAEPELLDFIMFLYHTATRPNEAMQLYDSDFLLDRKLLHIKSNVSKVGRERFIPMTDYIIKNYSGRKGKIFDFDKRHFSRRFSKLKRTLKISLDHTMYSIRHTRAIHLAEDGVSIYVIAQLFGHSNPMITMAYLREIGANINLEAVEKGIKF